MKAISATQALWMSLTIGVTFSAYIAPRNNVRIISRWYLRVIEAKINKFSHFRCVREKRMESWWQIRTIVRRTLSVITEWRICSIAVWIYCLTLI